MFVADHGNDDENDNKDDNKQEDDDNKNGTTTNSCFNRSHHHVNTDATDTTTLNIPVSHSTTHNVVVVDTTTSQCMKDDDDNQIQDTNSCNNNNMYTTTTISNDDDINECAQQIYDQQQQQLSSFFQQYNQYQLSLPKGIYNHTGTTCYINSALIILSYTLQPILVIFLQNCKIYYQHLRNNHNQHISSEEDIIATNNNNNNNNNSNTITKTLSSLSVSADCSTKNEVKSASSSIMIHEFIMVLHELLNIPRPYSFDAADHNDDEKQQQQQKSNVGVFVDPTRFYQSITKTYTSNNKHNKNTYNSLITIQYETFGDAITTLLHLLQFLLEIETIEFHANINNNKNNIPSSSSSTTSSPSTTITDLRNVYDAVLYSGKVYSSIIGQWTCQEEVEVDDTTCSTTTTTTINNNNNKNNIITIRKELKPKSLSNPLLVPIVKEQQQQQNNQQQQPNDNHDEEVEEGDIMIFTSLEDALHDMFMKEHGIDGYQWNTNEIYDKDISGLFHIGTKRQYHVLSFPPILMIQLQRFTTTTSNNIDNINQQQQQCRYVRPIENYTTPTMIIPETLNTSVYIQNQSTTDTEINVQDDHDDTTNKTTCTLVGGIIHIHDYSDDTSNNNDNNEENHIGHYVTVIRQQQGEEENHDQWYVIDDEIVKNVSIEQVLLWFGGDWYNYKKLLFARGVLLIYHRSYNCTVTITDLSHQQQSTTVEHCSETCENRHFCSLTPETESSNVSSKREQNSRHPSQSHVTSTTPIVNKTKSYWLDDSSSDSNDDNE